MKKIFLSFLFSLFVLVLYAQDNRAGFGIRGGFGYANITNPGNFNSRFSYKQHIQLGIYTEVKILDPLFLQIELLFSNPGTRLFQIDQNGYKIRDSIFNFNCLLLPIEAKIKIGNEKVKGYYMLGVAPSFLINSSLRYKMDSTASYFFNYTPYETRFTVNLMNTIGVEIDIHQPVTPFVDFRYVQGLTNVHRERALRPETNLQFLLSVGIRF